ncbi:MAG: BON domain-containing protein [Betaproteobacteria bacterium]|jgi:osmotically-inducible protein OsmY|nr:BON domain-containing protein [Betaproteobacteria bacterium]NBS47924.1 BON domain-containing protein [Betaproteobacteria bacterium]
MNSLLRRRLALASVVALAPLALGLSGCAPLLMGGAAATTVLVNIDRRTSGTQVEDEAIELKAASRIRDAFGDRVHVNVTSYNRMVLLSGEVHNEQAKAQARAITERVENVKSVLNELAVMDKSTLTQRSNDALITGRVKAALIDAKDVSASAVKVVTERGTVFLMGRVTTREAERASAVARGVPSVQKVVRAFEYLTEDELKTLQSSFAR